MTMLQHSVIESGGYNIDRSLRFRSSASAYLSRTPASASNRTTWTWSGWVKLGKIDQTFTLFRAGVTNDTNNRAEIDIDSYSQSLVFYSADGGVTKNYLVATPVMRDPSAWYHIMCVYDSTNATASNRVKLYMNGSQITALSTATYAAQNTTTVINNNVFHVVSYNNYSSGPAYSDGYLAEVNFIDGQALTPSSFGEFSTETGVWVPKKYTGTYGTNGFYLDFKDNTSATTLAYDKSGNGNNWTPNNISTTAGATYDSMTDVPTLTSATAANYCVLNPLYVISGLTAPTYSNGNLTITGASGASPERLGVSSFFMSSGKWYCEAVATNPTSSNSSYIFAGGAGYSANGNRYLGGWAAYGASFTTGDVIGVAVDCTTQTVTFYKNGVSQGDISSAFVAGSDVSISASCYNLSATPSWDFNFGQRPFSYTPPTGFKALNTFNLPDPTIKKPNQYMDATTYTGNGGALTVTNSGFQPDLIWAKSRSAANWHGLWDSVRGSNNLLYSNATDAEGNASNLNMSVNSTGWSMNGANSSFNANGSTQVGWQWKKGATPGFDIVTYTGTGANANISHSLGVAPKMIIVKSRSIVSPNYGWQVQHTSLGATKSIVLNSTSAALTSTGFWNDTAPTSSVFTVGNDWDVNKSAATYVAYLFAEIAGFSKFGSYTGNGSTDGPFVYCGFRPKYVMVKRTDAANNWNVIDSVRSEYNVVDDYLFPNLSNAEAANVAGYEIDFTSNGFKLRGTGTSINASGASYIYAAFAENPFKYSNAR